MRDPAEPSQVSRITLLLYLTGFYLMIPRYAYQI
jgi:hypothetical protein